MSSQDNGQSLFGSAISAYNHGRYAEAERICGELLRLDPHDPASITLKSVTLMALSRFSEAADTLLELTRVEPKVPEHWTNLATALRGAGNLDGSLAAYARAGALGAKSANFFYNVGLLHMDRGDYESALAVLNRAKDLAPDDAEICFHYAHCCNDCQQNEEAVATLQRWQYFKGLTSELVAKIGLLLMNLGEPQRAHAAIEAASSDPNPTPLSRLKLAQILERINRINDARQQLNALKRDPTAYKLGKELLVTEAQLAQREGLHAEACRLFRQALDATPEFHLRHTHLFPLARSLDALQHFDDAFEALAEAHRSQMALLDITAPDVAARKSPAIHIAHHSCLPDDIANWRDSSPPSLEESPIFIVAFPRSGTTLLEQALDAHPNLKSMDEQPFLQNAIDAILADKIRYPSELAQLNDEQLGKVRGRYWELVRTKVQIAPGQRLLDKNPLNLLRLPTIRRLFPQSKILLAIRHPCDVILSCYMQHFTAPEFVQLCRDPITIAVGYRQSFDFWYQQAELLRPDVREVRYEFFVSNFESELSHIAEFLHIPWDDAMLAPAVHARNKGFISTPSYSQVIEPVNSKAVGRWRNYEAHFAGVLEVVASYLHRWKYPY